MLLFGPQNVAKKRYVQVEMLRISIRVTSRYFGKKRPFELGDFMIRLSN